ncbi:MAG TPA: hypothetical protein VHO91_20355 [Rhodopila sp.]|nr:hypothetical protein [Rhodopila sp.]
MLPRAVFLLSVLLPVISGCAAYDPPVQGDHASAKYKTDLEACRKQVGHAVYLKNAARPGTWVISPFTGPPQVRKGIRTCMVGKGYALTQP